MKIISFSGLVFVLPLIFVMACGNKETSTVTEALPPKLQEEIPVRITAAKDTKAAEKITATGRIAADSEARLSFKTGGVVERIFTDEGATVKKGQLLATLNLTEIAAQVRQTEEGLQKAQRDLQRVQNLHRDSVATLEQLQNATTAVNVSKENVAIAKFNQSYSEIHAPMSGKILRKLMNEGELAAPGVPVFVMYAAGANDWVVIAGLTDKDFVQLQLGDRANIVFDAYPNQIFEAKVHELPESADPSSGLYPVEFKINTQGKRFTHGMFATVTLETSNNSYVSVPIDAIIEGNGTQAYVFVPDSNKVKKVPVRVAFLNGEEVMLSSGISAGTFVITSGSAYLTEKSIIKIIE